MQFLVLLLPSVRCGTAGGMLGAVAPSRRRRRRGPQLAQLRINPCAVPYTHGTAGQVQQVLRRHRTLGRAACSSAAARAVPHTPGSSMEAHALIS